ncbi:hypothetical protein D9M69_567460 [compost metagenome]
MELVVLVGGAEEVGAALRAGELARAGVGREVGHLGVEQRRAHGQRHVGADGAAEDVDLVALDHAVDQLLGLVGAAGHVGLHELHVLPAELAAQLLDAERKTVACLGTQSRERP